MKTFNLLRRAALPFAALLFSAFFFVYPAAPPVTADDAAVLPGIGTVTDQSSSTVEGVTFTSVSSVAENGLQKTFIAEIPAAADAEVYPYLYYGSSITDRVTMTDAIADVESRGKRVICGTNADAYDMSTGVPNGVMIEDGRIVLSPDASAGNSGIGFHADGTHVYGKVDLTVTLNIGKGLNVQAVNRDRGVNAANIFMYTSDYGAVTASKKAGIEITVTTENPVNLTTSGTFTGTVTAKAEVSDNSNGNSTPIGENTFILAAGGTKNSLSYALLNDFDIDDTVSITVTSGAQWSPVKTAVGVFQVLVKDGVPQGNVMTNPEVAPRSALGIDSDGKLYSVVIDGRKAGYSVGVTWAQLINYMKDSLGCNQIFNFDGGGSSTFAAYDPATKRTKRINKPEGGETERPNTNYLFFVQDVVSEISVTASAGGRVEGDTSAKWAESKTFTLVPDESYLVKSVTVNGSLVTLSGNSFTVSDIRENVSVSAVFEKDPNWVDPGDNPGDSPGDNPGDVDDPPEGCKAVAGTALLAPALLCLAGVVIRKRM